MASSYACCRLFSRLGNTREQIRKHQGRLGNISIVHRFDPLGRDENRIPQTGYSLVAPAQCPLQYPFK